MKISLSDLTIACGTIARDNLACHVLFFPSNILTSNCKMRSNLDFFLSLKVVNSYFKAAYSFLSISINCGISLIHILNIRSANKL